MAEMMTMKETAEQRMADKVEARRRIYLRLSKGDVTIDQLSRNYLAQNYNNIMLFDTLSIVAYELWMDYTNHAAYVPATQTVKNCLHRMERNRQLYETFRRTLFRSKERVFERITDLYYEAVMRPMQMLEINIKQQLDKMGMSHSQLLARLEMMRQITLLGVGIKWAIEDISYVVKNPTRDAGLVGGACSQVDFRADMTGIQHWIAELEKALGMVKVKATQDVERSFEALENRVISADLCLETTIIIADEMEWQNLPEWFPLLGKPTDEIREAMKYKTRKDIEK